MVREEVRDVMEREWTPLVPSRFFLTSGVGVHKHELVSLELALQQAGIEGCNLSRVTSTVPVGCVLVSRDEGIKQLRSGQITFAVQAKVSTCEPHRRIAAALGLVVPADSQTPGCISAVEESGAGDERSAADLAELVALEVFAARTRTPFDADAEWDRKKRVYQVGDKTIHVKRITEVAIGRDDGQYTSVLTAAVFLF
jgi:arginine decarboxylase